MKSFTAFMGSKEWENKEHLHLLGQIYEKAGFRVANHITDKKEPYVYIKKPEDVEVSFGGIRLYTRGKDMICYRSQNKETTEPFGEARQLDITSMYKDMLNSDKKLIGLRIIFYLVKELRDFFDSSADAEKDIDVGDDDGMGAVVTGSMGAGDYSNTVTGDMSWRR